MNNKFKFAVKLEKYNNQTVLDLGCRDKELKKYLHKDRIYQGIDFIESEEVLGINLENGIPVGDNSYDIVYALDVLEHLENIHLLLDEIKRVAKNEIIIALPNCYHWHYKINMLLNKPINTKYELSTKKVLDRHRWVTFHRANINLINNTFNFCKIDHFGFICNYNKYRFLFNVDMFLSKIIPDTFVYCDFFHIDLR